MTMTRTGEQGVALVISLFLMGAMSALAVSLMFLAQTETSASRNYKTMSQARYAGEAGVHKTLNYFTNGYVVPTSTAGFTTDVSPVRYNGNPVILSSMPGTASNYPVSAVATAFAAATAQDLAGQNMVRYGAVATLLQMRSVNVYGGGGGVIQTWEITASGMVGPGAQPATVEVKAMLERNLVDAETFAVFATSDACGAITYTGSGGTNSYNSSVSPLPMSGGKPVTTDGSGAVGTNGNLSLGGSVTINGSLSTPRSGVGACSAGSPTAMTGTPGNVTEGLIQLPQAKAYPTPVIPAPGTDDFNFHTSTSALTCTTLFATLGWNCSRSGSTWTISPMAAGTPLPLRNVTIGSNQNLVIGGTGTATLNWNTLSVAGNTNLTINASLTELNLAGNGVATGADVLDFQGNFSTTAWDPSKFQIFYAGTSTIKLRGNNDLAATIYAPNAHVDLSSSYDVWGSILSKTYRNSGGAMVHYDTALASKYKTLGNHVMSSFSWRKY